MGVSTFLYETMGSIENYNAIEQWVRNYVSTKTAVSIGNVTTALQVLIDRTVEFSYSILKHESMNYSRLLILKENFFGTNNAFSKSVKQSEIINF